MKNWKRWLYAIIAVYLGKRFLAFAGKFAVSAGVIVIFVYIAWLFFKQS